MVSKSICSWILQGVCSSSGNIMAFWETNFNMPVPCLFDGCSNCAEGWIDARYCDMGFSSFGLGNMKAGYEVALADGVFRWETGSGECLNGIVRLDLDWYRGACCYAGARQQICVNIPEFYIQWEEKMFNTGIAGWEICCNGTYCTKAQATNVSGDDLSIGACTICLDFFSVPSTFQTNCPGAIWVEGNNLNFINANRWEHSMTGVCQGSGGVAGSIWIDNTHYLNWTNSGGCIFKAAWRICQFCSSFSNGSPANPAPGAGYKGAIWADNEFGWTHLAYIGCDGNKYLTGAAVYPYSAP